MKRTTWIGVDPGKNGGISFIFHTDPVAYKIPETNADLVELLRNIQEMSGGNCFACLERVSSSPQMGVVSAFTFGQGYGALQMALTACGIPFELVSPAVWQREMKCLSRGDKNVTKRRAQELFPTIKISHAIADSLLIAEYCRRTFP